MVKIFNAEEQHKITAAIEDAERRTNAEIAVLVAPISDAYQEFRLFYAFIIGTIASLIIIYEFGDYFGWFMFTATIIGQIIAIGVASCLPWFDSCSRFLVPNKILQHRTYQRATAEYFALSHHVKAKTPIVFIFLSKAERKVYIISGRIVREVLPSDIWKQRIDDLTSAIRNEGLANACVKSVHQIADLLAPHFPDDGGHNALPNEVRQVQE